MNIEEHRDGGSEEGLENRVKGEAAADALPLCCVRYCVFGDL